MGVRGLTVPLRNPRRWERWSSHVLGAAPMVAPHRTCVAEIHKLEVSLEDVYSGKTRKMAINRDVIDRDKGVKT